MIEWITIFGAILAAGMSLATFYSHKREGVRLANAAPNEKDALSQEKDILTSASHKLDEVKMEMARLESLLERESVGRNA